jgi:CBS domain-containing protein
MSGHARGIRVQVFLGESEQEGHRPRYQALLEYLRREGAAGATVTRGIAGFGVNSKIKTSTILRLSMDLPVVLTWIDAPERVERLLPGLQALSGSGIVTVEEVGIAGYGGRRLEQLRFDLPVRDVMRRDVVSVRDDTPVREAVEALLGQAFRALPVVDAGGRLVGILANSDLLAAGVPVRLELLSAMPPDARAGVLGEIPAITAGAAMRPSPVTLRPADTLGQATRTMREGGWKRLPVVDDAGRLVGILSRADVLRAVADAFPRASGDGSAQAGARTVADVMRADAPVVRSDAPLHEVVDAVAATRLNRAVVVDADGRVAGVVTDADVLRSAEPAARPGVVGALMRAGGVATGSTTAGDLLAGPSPLVRPETPLADAAQAMVAGGRKLLPVVDADGRLLGIVDRADLLRAASDALATLVGVDVDEAE